MWSCSGTVRWAARIAGLPFGLRRIPSWIRPILGAFVPAIRALAQMRFQTDGPYRVDASKYARRFGAAATPFEDGRAATVAGYRAARDAGAPAASAGPER